MNSARLLLSPRSTKRSRRPARNGFSSSANKLQSFEQLIRIQVLVFVQAADGVVDTDGQQFMVILSMVCVCELACFLDVTPLSNASLFAQ